MNRCVLNNRSYRNAVSRSNVLKFNSENSKKVLICSIFDMLKPFMCLFKCLIFHCLQSKPLMCLFFRQRLYVLCAYFLNCFLKKKNHCPDWKLMTKVKKKRLKIFTNCHRKNRDKNLYKNYLKCYVEVVEIVILLDTYHKIKYSINSNK